MGLVGLLLWSVSKADINLSSPTPGVSTGICRVKTVSLDYLSQTATIYYGFIDGNGSFTVQGGSFTIPFPAPTPGVLGTIKQAAEKTLAGYSSGTVGVITPVAIGTVVP